MRVRRRPPLLHVLIFSTNGALVSQDTFSFSLVLLCLAVGDISFVRNRGRAISKIAYATGFRYKIPKYLRKACPEIAALIKEMWDGDFRKRPLMKDVVVRLAETAAALLDRKSMKPSLPPEIVEPGIFSTLPSTSTPLLLEAFAGVTSTDIGHVEDLLNELPSLGAASDYVGGSVALLRIVRREPTLELRLKYAQNMLRLRVKLGSDAKADEIVEQSLSLHTLPSVAALQAASWEINECVGTDKQGDVVVFERWGAIDPTQLVKLSVDDFRICEQYRVEARGMTFDLLSRRAKRVVRFSHVLDCRGATLAHRKMLPYIKEWAGGEATALVPSMRKTTSFVRSNRFAAAIFNLSTGFFKQQQQTTFLLTGADPFDASVVFSASFERSSLPTDVGGSLTIGSDGHCCRGVILPALNDADAVWSFYTELLSPSLQQALMAEPTRAEGSAVSSVEEIALLRAQLAEKDAEIAELKAQLPPPIAADSA